MQKVLHLTQNLTQSAKKPYATRNFGILILNYTKNSKNLTVKRTARAKNTIWVQLQIMQKNLAKTKKKTLKILDFKGDGGGRGIRTPVGFNTLTVFKDSSF